MKKLNVKELIEMSRQEIESLYSTPSGQPISEKVIAAMVLHDPTAATVAGRKWLRGLDQDKCLVAIRQIMMESQSAFVELLPNDWVVTVPLNCLFLIKNMAIALPNITSDEFGEHMAVLSVKNHHLDNNYGCISMMVPEIRLKMKSINELHTSGKIKQIEKTEFKTDVYNAANLFKVISKAIGGLHIDKSDSKLFYIDTKSIENFMFKDLCKYNRDAIKSNKLEGKKVLYKPFNKNGNVVKVLDSGEIILKFDEPIKSGHSFDGSAPKGTCLTTDETTIDIQRDISALNIEYSIY
jgi:hypothetical protein